MFERYKTAFTLIELLVVIAIIGILSGLIIVGMSSSVKSATIAKAQIFSASLRDSMLANLISEWKFDGSGITDANPVTNGTVYLQDSWSGNNVCTIAGGGPLVYSGSNCVYGSCLKFNGTSDYIDCTSGSNLNNVNSLTIEIWLYPQVKVTNMQGDVVGKWANTNQSYLVYIENDNTAKFRVSSTGSDRITFSISTSALSVNNWYHLVATYNGSNIKTYLNGANITTTNYSSGIYASTASLKIGNAGEAGIIKGFVDNVRVYSAAIPTSQIKEQYYAGLNILLAKGEITKKEYMDKINYE